MLSDEKERGEVEFLIARNHYRGERLSAALIALKELRQKYAGAPAARDAAILAARALIKYDRSEEAEPMLSRLVREAPRTAHAALALHTLAKVAADSDDYERAIEHSTRWLKESPTPRDQFDVTLILARAKLETGSTAEALALSSWAAKTFPESPKMAEALVLRGRAHEGLGEMDKAEASYVKAVELEPDTPWPYRSLARFYRSIGKLPEAIDLMERAGGIAPDEDILWMELTELYRRNGDDESALALLRVFTHERQLSPNITRTFMMMADIQMDMGSTQDAYTTLERLIAAGMTATDLSVVYDRQGDILDETGLHDAAVEKYRLAAENGGNVAAEKIKIARVFLENGRTKECVDELAEIEPGAQPPEIRFDLLDLQASAFVELEKYVEARRMIREAMSLRSGREKFSTLASLMQVNLALEDTEAASEIYELTLKLIDTDDPSEQAPPDSRRIILKWARNQYDTGEYARAAEAYSRVTASAFPISDVAWALYQRGNCHYHMAEYEKASELYTRLTAEFADSEWVKFAKAKERLMVIGAGAGT
jgi:tetratricopeptide (TPR) repeat protein